MIKIYNSLTNKLEEFKPIQEGKLTIYVCGPTVYNKPHIGNSRPVVFFDTVVRFFKYLGYEVTYVSNFTDIDDKIINKAIEENTTEKVISERYIEANLRAYRKLNCLPYDYNPKVTENIDGIIEFISELIEKGGAYEVDGDVYFDTTKIDEYGVLSGQTIENLISGARIETNDKKRHSVDFALWKKTDVGIKWPSPWGEGRPGWHTECVVMINKILGNQIDIHGGGSDLKFPHHDNEIAQSICNYDNKIANYWIHNGRIDLSGEKMSKSLGNVIWAEDLVEQMGYQAYRMMFFNTPYRQQINYKEEMAQQAKNDIDKMKRTYVSLFRKVEMADVEEFGRAEITYQDLVDIKTRFIEAMSNDFNTPNAVTELFNITKLTNTLVRQNTSADILNQCLALFSDMLWVLGINFEIEKLSPDDLVLVKEWQEARNNKDFQKADELRKEIMERNISL